MNAIILSGGKGSRLGNKIPLNPPFVKGEEGGLEGRHQITYEGQNVYATEKAFLTLGKETFMERKIKKLKPLFEEIIIVTNAPLLYSEMGVRVIKDEKEGVGPLMGLYCGLKNSSSDYNFVTTSDTPFLKIELVQYLIEKVDGYDALVPKWRGMTEPLCAIYSKRCIPHIEKVMGERVTAFYKYVNAKLLTEKVLKKIDPEGLSFFNVNTPEDYNNMKDISRKEKE